ncbi:glycoside hydrolase family 10 protein [Coleofasciculus sp. FACHB-T130]|uniref:glycoside hydrolase family 10 protein n=1 Tax=Coleofasciculus sp. FACHB-T130 TaxID=2692792 RepID=UPI0032205CC0
MVRNYASSKPNGLRRSRRRKRKGIHTWFISLLCLGLAIAFSIYSPQFRTNSPPSVASTELRGVWLTNVASSVLFMPWGVNRAMHQLSQLHFNTVYPVVWNRGHTFYPSTVARRKTGRPQDQGLELLGLGRDVLAEIIKQGNRQQIRVIPWFEYGFMAPASSELAKRHPDWISLRQDGTKNILPEILEQGLRDPAKPNVQPSSRKVEQFIRNQFARKVVWLNPLHPEVQQFILNLMVEVVTEYDVAGIQMDDHFGLPVEFGYDPFTVELYRQEHQGKSPPTNPKDAEWMSWRANKITDFMQRLFQSIKSVKPGCLVSLSPNPYSFAYRFYLQDWQTWVQRGLVEELVVQVYRDDLKSFLAELSQPSVQMARRQIPVGVGILSGLVSRPVDMKQIQQQVQAVRDRGFSGVSFFYWESLWGYMSPEPPKRRREAFRALFPASATRPQVLPSGNR